jgi:hypothetical protein
MKTKFSFSRNALLVVRPSIDRRKFARIFGKIVGRIVTYRPAATSLKSILWSAAG